MIEGGCRRKPETNVVRNGRRCGGGGGRAEDLQAKLVQEMVPKSMLFLALIFIKILDRFVVPFGVPFC